MNVQNMHIIKAGKFFDSPEAINAMEHPDPSHVWFSLYELLPMQKDELWSMLLEQDDGRLSDRMLAEYSEYLSGAVYGEEGDIRTVVLTTDTSGGIIIERWITISSDFAGDAWAVSGGMLRELRTHAEYPPFIIMTEIEDSRVLHFLEGAEMDELSEGATAASSPEDWMDGRFILQRGLRDLENDCSCISGLLRDMRDLPMSAGMGQGLEFVTPDRVSPELLSDYILQTMKEEYGWGEVHPGFSTRLSEILRDPEMFMEESIICLRKGNIEAAVLMSEIADRIRVGWMHGGDSKSLYCCLSMISKKLISGYALEKGIDFLVHKRNGRAIILKLLREYEEQPLSMYLAELYG